MWQFIRNKNGAILPFVAVGILVFLGLVALAVDLGYMFTVKSGLQNAADATALAGAGDICNYEAMSKELAKENGVDLSNVQIGLGNFDKDENPIFSPDRNPPNAVEVVINETHGTFFGGILGINDVDIGVKAVATTTGPLCCPMKDIIPIAIHEESIPKALCIKDRGMYVYQLGEEIEIWDYQHCCHCGKVENLVSLHLEGMSKICVGDWVEGETCYHKCHCHGEDIGVSVGDEGILVVFRESKENGGHCCCKCKEKFREYHVADLLAVRITKIGTNGHHGGCCHNQYIKARLIEWRNPDITFDPSVPFNPTLPTPPKLVF